MDDPAPKRSVFLVGPMGSGKTAVGRQLASRLGLPFADSDAEIESRTGVDIAYIFEREGEARFRELEASALQEVATRGGQIILISDAEPEKVGCKLAAHIEMPAASAFTNPLIYAVPVQLLAYHTAVIMGTDVDQPRNLAKSVTVE